MDEYKTSVTLLIDEGEIVSHTKYEMMLYFHLLVTNTINILRPVMKKHYASGSIVIEIDSEKVVLLLSLSQKITEIEVQEKFAQFNTTVRSI